MKRPLKAAKEHTAHTWVFTQLCMNSVFHMNKFNVLQSVNKIDSSWCRRANLRAVHWNLSSHLSDNNIFWERQPNMSETRAPMMELVRYARINFNSWVSRTDFALPAGWKCASSYLLQFSPVKKGVIVDMKSFRSFHCIVPWRTCFCDEFWQILNKLRKDSIFDEMSDYLLQE